MPTRIVDVQFPLAGLNRAQAFSKQQQAPYTTYDAENVRPRDKDLERLTGGSRPGIELYATTNFERAQFLNTVSVKNDSDYAVWEDTFNSESLSHYQTITNLSNTSLPSISSGVISCSSGSTTDNRSIRIVGPLVNFDASKLFRFGAHVISTPGDTAWPFLARIYFGMTASSDADNCYYLQISRTNLAGGTSLVFKRVVSGSVTYTSHSVAIANGTYPGHGFFEVEVLGDRARAYWRSTQADTATSTPLDATLPAAVTSSQTGIGVYLGMPSATSTLNPTKVDRIYAQYRKSVPHDSSRRRLITSLAGVMQCESFRGNLVPSTSPMQLASSGAVDTVESGQRLFIADNPVPVAQGTDGEFSSSGTVFDSASYTDWTTVLTNARRGDYYLQIDPLPRPLATAIAGTYTFSGDDLQATRFTDGYFGNNPTVSLYMTNGTLSLSGVTDLTFTVGDGTADTAMTFTSSAATPALKWAAISNALTNAVYTSTATNNIYAELSLVITGAAGNRIDTIKIKKEIANNDISQTQGLSEFVTNFEIDAVAAGSLTVTGGPASATTGVVWRVIRAPKVYDPLADEETAVASNANWAITSDKIFDSTAYAAWATTLAGKDLSKYSVQILTSGVVTEEYPIVGFDSSNIGGDTNHLLLGPATTDSSAASPTKTFQITRRDKLTKWVARRGEVPVGCSMIERYQDRTVMAGNARSPQNWYMSRMGDALDFQYSDVDVGAAVMGINSPAGVVGDAITSLIPYNDDNFFFGCRSSLWLLRGNPAGGGRIDNVSYTVGVIGPTAWCHGPAGEVIWISRDGIYYTSPQCLSCEPIAMSRDKLPKEFVDINADLYHISMAYDVRERGVHVYLTPNVGTYSSTLIPTGVRHWFIHWDSKTFWPVTFSNKEHCPVAAIRHTAISPIDSGILFAAHDGDIFRYSTRAWSDDKRVLNSYVNIGPMPIVNSPYHRGIIRTIDVVMGETSEDTTWALYEGGTAEEVATAATAFQTGTFTEGAQTTIAPLMGGSNWRMKISSSGPWSFASATAVISQLGKDRSYG